MTQETQRSSRRRTGFLVGLALLAVLLVIFVVPSLISIGRYKSRIARLVSASMGRPVHLSSVELRLLPRPGFVMTDLSVDEDPAFGAEPILHANSVTAAVRLFALLAGRVEISRISVDEASLNLVRNRDGNWNFDALLQPATQRAEGTGRSGHVPPFPYLEATNSRVNLKNGPEKLPYSLVNADAALWQENPGDWRLRLRGQPAKTDVSLDLADTGVVRLEARLARAADRAHMPIHLTLDWREAQLGQLSRLVLGSDPGWRGDLTGELQLDGTTEAAQVKTRLSAIGVHRAEFAPADAMDFDANCGFLYRYAERAIENLVCDSPFGEGHVRVEGAVPPQGPGKLAVQLENVPVSAGLDAMRTLRSGIDETLEARGTITGRLTYDPGVLTEPFPTSGPTQGRARRAKTTRGHAPPHPSPLAGSLAIDQFRLAGNGLTQPIQITRIVLAPADAVPGQPQALLATFPLSEGGPAPVAVSVNLGLNGYTLNARGPAALPRLRELARVAGIATPGTLDGLAGDPATLDLSASGTWVPAPEPIFPDDTGKAAPPLPDPGSGPGSDQVTGTISLHNANWKLPSLASLVEVAQATLRLDGDTLVWDPVEFNYGPVAGRATLRIARRCAPGAVCPPEVDLKFAALDGAELEAALLGARQPDTVLSSLIARISPTSSPAWPQVKGTVAAGTLTLGPVTLHDAAIDLNVEPARVAIPHFEARILEGSVDGTATVAAGLRPQYTLEGDFKNLSGEAVCRLLGLECTGGQVAGHGKVEMAGFSDLELAASAKGTLHLEWRRGAIDSDPASEVPPALARFDALTADATIAPNSAKIRQGHVKLGNRTADIDANVTFADPPRVEFGPPTEPAPPPP